MRSTNFIVATAVVIAATLNFGAEGFPRPQAGIRDGLRMFMVDGFAFDGPVSGSKPSTKAPELLKTTTNVARFFSTLPPTVTPNPPNPTPAPATAQPDVVQCARNCRFQVTPEYNPVCGSDGVMYKNGGTLVCTKNCGINVTQLHPGRCISNVRG